MTGPTPLTDEELSEEIEAVALAHALRAEKAAGFTHRARLLATIADRDRRIAEATGYAERLLVALEAKHFGDNPNWRPLSGDMIGILTQIDNLTTALTRSARIASLERVAEAAHFLLCWHHQDAIDKDPPLDRRGWRITDLHPSVRDRLDSGEQNIWDALSALPTPTESGRAPPLASPAAATPTANREGTDSAGTVTTDEGHKHKTRYSDSSQYDEVCIKCGATDSMHRGRLHLPCPVPDAVTTAMNTPEGEAVDMDEPEPDYRCATCDGGGSVTVTVPECCGNLHRSGECRGHCAVPMDSQEACPDCDGSSRDRRAPTDEPEGFGDGQ